MAAMYQLVPVDWVRRHQELEQQCSSSPQHPAQANNNIIGSVDELKNITFNDDDDVDDKPGRDQLQHNFPTSDDFDEVELIFPKRMRGRAHVILKHVQMAGGKIDRYKRLIYPDGQVGSSLFELVQYTLFAKPFKSKRPQPIDWAEFGQLLRNSKAPSYILSNINLRQPTQTLAKTWLRLPGI
jgi:hypothetical protein